MSTFLFRNIHTGIYICSNLPITAIVFGIQSTCMCEYEKYCKEVVKKEKPEQILSQFQFTNNITITIAKNNQNVFQTFMIY